MNVSVGTAIKRAAARVKEDAWPLLQATAAATIAWGIASTVGNHPDPFFAPMAAVIGLNAERGERGLNALRLVSGVFIGIIVAELVLVSPLNGYLALASATLVATAIARAVGGARIVMAQAATSAILTVITAAGEGGFDRLVDASIGAGVALVFSQILFTPEPLALLRRSESTALSGIAHGLATTSQALEKDDDELASQAIEELRDMRDRLSELGRMRDASARVVRHSLVWRTRRGPVVHERENAGHLDLLGGSSVFLARTSLALDERGRRSLAPVVAALAGAIGDVAEDPGNRELRQGAADRALDLLRGDRDLGRDHTAVAAWVALRTLAIDVMVFAGVDPDEAEAAADAGTGELSVTKPPQPPRFPFNLWRRKPSE